MRILCIMLLDIVLCVAYMFSIDRINSFLSRLSGRNGKEDGGCDMSRQYKIVRKHLSGCFFCVYKPIKTQRLLQF